MSEKIEKITVDFTKDELNNLIVFLQRTQLTGNESMAMASILLKLSSSFKKEITTD